MTSGSPVVAGAPATEQAMDPAWVWATAMAMEAVGAPATAPAWVGATETATETAGATAPEPATEAAGAGAVELAGAPAMTGIGAMATTRRSRTMRPNNEVWDYGSGEGDGTGW